jgi:hypothetical protein
MLLGCGRMGGRWVGNPVAGVLLALCVSAFVLASRFLFLGVNLHARFFAPCLALIEHAL